MLGGGGDAARLEADREGDRGLRDRRRGGAEAAVGGGDHPAGTGDVEDRREVDVDAEALQVGGGRDALAARVGGPFASHLRRGRFRRPVDPLHFAALLVGHHQQRQAAQSAVGRGIACSASISSRPAARLGKSASKRTTPATLPAWTALPQFGRQPGPVDRDHDPLPGELRGRQPLRQASGSAVRRVPLPPPVVARSCLARQMTTRATAARAAASQHRAEREAADRDRA